MSNEMASERSLLGDLSLTQVVAGALAAAASFALAKQTGILGSVIGAALGSAAATIASQVFANVIDRSVEGIRGSNPAKMQRAQAGTRRYAAHRPMLAAIGALAIAALVGIGAVRIYAAAVDLATDGAGIGAQEPIIEYVMESGEVQDPTEQDQEGPIETVAVDGAAEMPEPDATPADEPSDDAAEATAAEQQGSTEMDSAQTAEAADGAADAQA